MTTAINNKRIYILYGVTGWERALVKPYILLRKLLDDNRAIPIVETKALKGDKIDDNEKSDEVIRKLFTDIPLDVFRQIISMIL